MPALDPVQPKPSRPKACLKERVYWVLCPWEKGQVLGQAAEATSSRLHGEDHRPPPAADAFTPQRGKEESAAPTASPLQVGRGGERRTGRSAIGAGAPGRPRIGCGQQSGSWCLSRTRWVLVVSPPRLGKGSAATWGGVEVSAHVQECAACVGPRPWLCEPSHLSLLPTLQAVGFHLGHVEWTSRRCTVSERKEDFAGRRGCVHESAWSAAGRELSELVDSVFHAIVTW